MMSDNNSIRYTHRFLARVTVEATTPLAVGSGEESVLSDSLVAVDINGLPYIPGTAVAGVLRHMVEDTLQENKTVSDEDIRNIFGYHDNDGGAGSKIIFSEAKILNSEGEPVDGLDWKAISQDSLLRYYKDLPVRQHVRINGKGVAEKGGKFDCQVVYTGTRFCFEIEMLSDGTDMDKFNTVLHQLMNRQFRIGSGTRKGYGAMQIADLKVASLNLRDSEDLNRYIHKTSSLNSEFWNSIPSSVMEEYSDGDLIYYRLSLDPESFFLFGSGFGDSEADMTPVKAEKVFWHNGTAEMKENLVLIPASSVKGALSHRTAFHWNRLNNRFADMLDRTTDLENSVGSRNDAVRLLFGSDGNGEEKDITRGNVTFSDLILDAHCEEKLLNHLSVDRFSGGAWNGALFSEKVINGNGHKLTLNIEVNKRDLRKACRKNMESTETLGIEYKINKVLKAFACALKDLCTGRLPLGGGVNRGNGLFTGKLEIIGYEE